MGRQGYGCCWESCDQDFWGLGLRKVLGLIRAGILELKDADLRQQVNRQGFVRLRVTKRIMGVEALCMLRL